MTWWLVLIVLVCLACLISLLKIYRERKRQASLVRKIRATELYGHLYPLLIRCDRHCVESVELRAGEMVIRTCLPAGRCLRYDFERHGFDLLPPDPLYALAQAVAVDMPTLRDQERYHFRTHTLQKPSGGRERWYEYVIRIGCKDDILRAAYMKRK